jgi:hypothetical protein
MSLTPEAVALLRKVVAYAEQEPRRFNMSTFYEDVVSVVKGEGITVKRYSDPIGGWFGNAQKLFGLTVEQAQRLFYPYKGFGLDGVAYWPEPFASDYMNNKNDPEARVEIMAARVEHFINTNGAE